MRIQSNSVAEGMSSLERIKVREIRCPTCLVFRNAHCFEMFLLIDLLCCHVNATEPHSLRPQIKNQRFIVAITTTLLQNKTTQ